MSNNEDLILRLRRIEGQVRGIQKMIEEERECESVLQQVSAARSGLYRVGISYVSANLRQCVDSMSNCPPDVMEKVKKLAKSLAKFG
ncbi:MAG: metal-sensitive transcriptional regulator [Candidatus Eremiobacteraeota bacterium]|nr:metal-sensitive transcriptional regulator [Candidatus Eremiobacteraeota bacterium]